MDILSDILSVVRVEGGLFSRASLSAPFGISTREAESAIFHVVVEGAGWVRSSSGECLPWSAGDLVLLPRGDAHEMLSAPGVASSSIGLIQSTAGADGLACLKHGGDGARTSLLCGSFRFGQAGRDFLVGALPSLMVVRAEHIGPTARWLDVTMQMMSDEVDRGTEGSRLLVPRLADVLFVQILRGWIRDAPPGWLGALADPQMHRAMTLIHQSPARAWTIPELARAAGMSRSAFFTQFKQKVGEPPAAYLTRWRMVLARGALRSHETAIADIAERVGYASTAAFSRAFKRNVGVSPAAWRREAG